MTRADELREAIAVLEARLAGSEGALEEARAHTERAETSRGADRARAEALRQMLNEAEATEERARARAETAEDYVAHRASCAAPLPSPGRCRGWSLPARHWRCGNCREARLDYRDGAPQQIGHARPIQHQSGVRRCASAATGVAL